MKNERLRVVAERISQEFFDLLTSMKDDPVKFSDVAYDILNKEVCTCGEDAAGDHGAPTLPHKTWCPKAYE